MYESFFQLQERPFSAAPVARRYFAGQSIAQARQNIVRCIERGDGPAVVIGPAGVGKTLLSQVLADQFRSKYHLVLLTSVRINTQRELLQNILFELNLPYRGLDEGEMRLTLLGHVEPGPQCPHGVLLIIDEAHTLSAALLEEIRMITNRVRDGQPRVRLVLAGNPSLEEMLADPQLDSFNQRIAARCYLHPWNREETIRYVGAQLENVGGSVDRIFTPDALHAVFRATDGVPRLVNQICDHALMLASLAGRKRLDGKAVEEAWADLQQLPAPWPTHRLADEEAEGGIIEFGQLPEEAAEQSEATPADDSPSAPATPAAADSNVRSTPRLLNPDAQIGDMKHRIAQLQEDFPEAAPAPAASAAPEVELVFGSAEDPFAEPFQEEEVVVDHNAALLARRTAGASGKSPEQTAANLPHASLPHVTLPHMKQPTESSRKQSSQESAQIVANGEPFAVLGSTESMDSLYDEDGYVAAPGNEDNRWNWSSEASGEILSDVTDEPVPASVPLRPDVESGAEAAGDSQEPGDKPQYAGAGVDWSPLFSERCEGVRPVCGSLAAAGHDDRDMILVDDVELPATDGRSSAATGRRQEYRQLFANLRRR